MVGFDHEPAPINPPDVSGLRGRGHGGQADVCPACGSIRTVTHDELWTLSIAHVDCDAFYAAVEIRDNPALANGPVIVGGGVRGVVPFGHYDEPEILRYAITSICPKGADVRQHTYVEAALEWWSPDTNGSA